MSMQDPLADMLTRIRNAQMAGIEQISMNVSKTKAEIAKELRDEDFVAVSYTHLTLPTSDLE